MRRSDTLRRARERKAWTQADLATQLNVTPGYISKLETGKIPITHQFLADAAEKLDDLQFLRDGCITCPTTATAKRIAAKYVENIQTENDGLILEGYVKNTEESLERLKELNERVPKTDTHEHAIWLAQVTQELDRINNSTTGTWLLIGK